MEFFLYIIVGAVLGFFIGWMASNLRKRNLNASNDSTQHIQQLQTDNGILNDRLKNAIENHNDQKQEIANKAQKITDISADLAEWKEKNKNVEEKLATQKTEIEELQKKFTSDFENIASKILKENTKDFSQTHEKQLSIILNPFKEKIETFEKKVNDVYDKETKDRNSLKGEILQLQKATNKINKEAENLTKALKGDVKMQGNWGEQMLENILEASGLREGMEYEKQSYSTNEEGKKIAPDFIINLPDNKHIIADSKVSLIAYEQYINAEENDRKQFLKQHVISVKTHISSLSEKNYQNAARTNAPDFVLMFIPIEPAFGLATHTDSTLWNYAWDKKIVMVTPSTLMATLKVVASLWKHEQQSKNATQIAVEAGKMYDKLVNFLKDMEKIDNGLKSSRKAYNDAMNKLKTGTGNIVHRAKKIEELGAKPNKKIDNQFAVTDENNNT